MHYRRDEFFRLMEEIESQGGDHLDETHDNVFHTKLTGDHVKGIEIAYCGESALFEIPYAPVGHDSTMSAVKVCAVDDWIGRWPRFAGADAKGAG